MKLKRYRLNQGKSCQRESFLFFNWSSSGDTFLFLIYRPFQFIALEGTHFMSLEWIIRPLLNFSDPVTVRDNLDLITFIGIFCRQIIINCRCGIEICTCVNRPLPAPSWISVKAGSFLQPVGNEIHVNLNFKGNQ